MCGRYDGVVMSAVVQADGVSLKIMYAKATTTSLHACIQHCTATAL